jgi:hypothetical protein
MINQDEVFVITEDDILKPADKGKKNGGTARTASAPVRAAREDKAGTVEETVADRPAHAKRTRSRQGSPAAASSLSLFVWGMGQLYNGDGKLATLFALSQLFVLAFHYMLYMTWERIRDFAHLFFISEWELMLYASSIDFCVVLLMIYNVAHAYRTAESQAGRYRGIRKPILSGMASLVIPGWGQMLNGQLWKGVFFLFSFLVAIYLVVMYLHSPFYRILAGLDPQRAFLHKARLTGQGILFATALCWVLSVYDAALVGRHTKELKA